MSLQKARQVQERLAKRIKEQDDLTLPPQTVCGLDVSYIGETAIGAAVLLSYPKLTLIDQVVVKCRVSIPYIPTYLSFREYPPFSMAYSSLQKKPDVCFVDAHGRSHPRRIGAASHFGVIRNVPTIGVAKRILCGTPQLKKDTWSPLIYKDEIVGAEIKIKPRTNPIYVSVGHRVTLETAVKLTQQCITTYRLPEPILRAHNLATEYRNKLKSTLDTME
jgi:deoxyribonuclease V